MTDDAQTTAFPSQAAPDSTPWPGPGTRCACGTEHQNARTWSECPQNKQRPLAYSAVDDMPTSAVPTRGYTAGRGQPEPVVADEPDDWPTGVNDPDSAEFDPCEAPTGLPKSLYGSRAVHSETLDDGSRIITFKSGATARLNADGFLDDADPSFPAIVIEDQQGRVRHAEHWINGRRQDVEGEPAVRLFDKDGRRSGHSHYRDGLLHSPDDGPAHVRDGERIYAKNGKYHRDGDEPAIIRDGEMVWCKDGQVHRDGAPAIVTEDGEAWYRDGEVHREDGPAVVYDNGAVEHRRNGVLHNANGPALIDADGNEVYAYEGIVIRRKDVGGVQNMKRRQPSAFARLKDRALARNGRHRSTRMPMYRRASAHRPYGITPAGRMIDWSADAARNAWSWLRRTLGPPR